ncbi:ALG3 protein domain-containing protein [Ditylenchus destructor]|uniref:dolichyl-P-Man:Man5GlcNAc2-PP-dolichol alpha-1,3-mannosyltransferase n=1 Tax=Ditylenchus destructor TaxID=166010 RepID=A0AAD4NGI7_9BILA|nr:ALG3 protein domain-containing protein [Ditylenchus destructor]
MRRRHTLSTSSNPSSATERRNVLNNVISTVALSILTVNRDGFLRIAFLLVCIEAFLSYQIIENVPYTEIDWETYMQQVKVYINGERNYTKIEGPTGPIVYPAGHLHIFRFLYSITNDGKNIRLAQYLFALFYVFNLMVVFRLFYRSSRVPPFVLGLVCLTSYRIHSIFMLRLFNDPIAMMIFYCAVDLWLSQQWLLGCILYSISVSVKMNLLLFAPAVFFILLISTNLRRTIWLLTVCAIVQVAIAWNFLTYDPIAYFKRAFELSRVFMFKWTVNWRFLPEELFLDKRFHLFLLLLHLIAVGVFMFNMWFRSLGGLTNLLARLSLGIKTRLDSHDLLYALFTANFLGICFARSLHYQFYIWYYHSLAYLLFSTIFPATATNDEQRNWNQPLLSVFPIYSVILRVAILLGIENLMTSLKKVLGICHRSNITGKAATFSTTALNRLANQKATIPADVKVFDRRTKKLQRDRAAQRDNFDVFQYVKDEVGGRIADKVFDLTGYNEVCLDLGCGAGHIGPHLIKENVGTLMQCDMSEQMVRRSRGAPEDELPTLRVVADEELVPFRPESIDLILTSLSAHWINDLPGWFRRCLTVLRPDGCMIGALFSGETLYEMRVSLQLAEMERLGGMGAHISPFVEPQDIAGLMTAAGFSMVTLDVDEIEVGYPNMFALMYDLQGMAESNANMKRSGNLKREVLIAADCIYKSMYAKEDKYPATFQFISVIGWRPGPKMPKPAKRGSQSVSFKDVAKIVQP